MKKIILSVLLAASSTIAEAQSQDTLTLTLNQAIELAQKQSASAIAAQHTLRSAYWTYRYYKANFKPSVTLSSSPNFNRGIDRVIQPDGSISFMHVSQLSSDASLQISQNEPLTGGSFFVNSSIDRYDMLEGSGSTAYSTKPVTVGYQNGLLGYNDLKWDRKIEPLRWREAKKKYSETMELVASQTCNYFFSLATSQAGVDIARSNLASADTLCRYAEGRYNIGTISENEMLQLQLNQLNEETDLLDAQVSLDAAEEALRSYLDLPVSTRLRVIIDGNIDEFIVPLDDALDMAIRNNPDPDYYERSKMESRSNLAQVKASTGLRASLYMQFGLSQTGADLPSAYRNPSDMQYASVTVSVPILDWGKGKGQRQMAKSYVDLTDINAEQGMKAFEQNVTKMVQQFNLQSRRVAVAEQADKTAERRYEVARKLYVSGKNTILDLNSAISEKDAARRTYIYSVATYWNLYYGLRSMTGYDFSTDSPIDWELPSDLK